MIEQSYPQYLTEEKDWHTHKEDLYWKVPQRIKTSSDTKHEQLSAQSKVQKDLPRTTAQQNSITTTQKTLNSEVIIVSDNVWLKPHCLIVKIKGPVFIEDCVLRAQRNWLLHCKPVPIRTVQMRMVAQPVFISVKSGSQCLFSGNHKKTYPEDIIKVRAPNRKLDGSKCDLTPLLQRNTLVHNHEKK